MFKVRIEIDIENPSEVIKNQRGSFLGGASALMPKSMVKSKVEAEVKSEIIKTIDISLKEKFKEHGIQAKIDIE